VIREALASLLRRNAKVSCEPRNIVVAHGNARMAATVAGASGTIESGFHGRMVAG
jgi:hypothetical protein